MKIKTSELTGSALDWAVAKAADVEVRICPGNVHPHQVRMVKYGANYSPSTDWSQGGPIIGWEDIQLLPKVNPGYWSAMAPESKWCSGPTPLIAAMRCFVASKLGDEVEVPDELA